MKSSTQWLAALVVALGVGLGLLFFLLGDAVRFHEARRAAAAEARSNDEIAELPATRSVPGELRDGVESDDGAVDASELATSASREEAVPISAVRFFGRVVSSDGTPLEDVRVATSGVEVMTDPLGRFELDWAPPTPSVVVVSLEGWTSDSFVVVEGHETAERALTITLFPAARLVVTALGTPLESLSVYCVRPNGSLFLGSILGSSEDVVPDTTGEAPRATFEIDGLPAGVEFSVQIARADLEATYRRRDVVLEPGEVRELTFDLTDGAVVRGVLRDASGVTVPAEEIWILGGWSEYGAHLSPSDSPLYRTRTDDEGRFEFFGIEPGRWWVGVAPEEWHDPGPDLLAPVAELIELSPVDGYAEVVLLAHRGLYVRGRVVDPDGQQPVPAPSGVVATHREKAARVWADVSADGSFTLGPLAPGTYELRSGREGPFAEPEMVLAQAGDYDVELRLRRGHELRVTAVGAGGERVAARIQLARRGSGDRDVGPMCETDGTGSPVLKGLLAGAYRLVAVREDGTATGSVEFELPEDVDSRHVSVVLDQPSATLLVSHGLGADSARVSVWQAEVFIGWDFLAGRRVGFMAVPTGELDVVLHADGLEYERVVEVEPGEELRLGFTPDDAVE